MPKLAVTKSEHQPAVSRTLPMLQPGSSSPLPQIGDLFIHLGHLKLVSLPKLEKLPRLPNSLKTLDIERCDALVVTCQADVDMMR